MRPVLKYRNLIPWKVKINTVLWIGQLWLIFERFLICAIALEAALFACLIETTSMPLGEYKSLSVCKIWRCLGLPHNILVPLLFSDPPFSFFNWCLLSKYKARLHKIFINYQNWNKIYISLYNRPIQSWLIRYNLLLHILRIMRMWSPKFTKQYTCMLRDTVHSIPEFSVLD